MTEKKKAAKKVTTPKKATEEKVFDVASPGKTVASAHSKPVIVTNRSVVRDPMVTPLSNDKTEAGAEQPTEGGSSGPDETHGGPMPKMRIEPLHADVKPEVKAATDEAEDTPQEATEQPATETTEETQPEAKDEKPEESDSDDEDDEFSELNADAKKAKNKEAEAAAAAEQKRREEAEAAIASKQYFVPINAVQKRRSARTALVILAIIILLTVGVLVVADAGIVDIGMDPPTNFIAD